MRAKDIINKIINTSIDYKNKYNNESFYPDFYSINKLLYFIQKEMLRKYNRPVIESKIIATTSGPFIEETKEIFYKYNYDTIKEKQIEELVLPPSVKYIISYVVIHYGNLSNQEIGHLSKNESAYQRARLNKTSNIITNDLIRKTILEEKSYPKVYKKHK